MLRVWMVKTFIRAARKADLDEQSLREAAVKVSRGHIDARLTDILVKVRVGRRGGGKRSGYRLIIAVQQSDGSPLIFLEIYAKNKRADLTSKELEALQSVGKTLLNLREDQVRKLIEQGTFREEWWRDE